MYFQRYLLCKPVLPTHVEYAVLDTFDSLEEMARSADRRVLEREAEAKAKSQGGKSRGRSKTALAVPEIVYSAPIFVRWG